MIMSRNDKPPGGRPAQQKQREFSSEEEFQAFIHQKQGAHNHAPRHEYQGLSPLQMHRLLTLPFDSPDLAVFNPRPASVDGVPFIRVFRFLAETLPKGGLKATAAGNLPRQLCRDAALDFWGPTKYAELLHHTGLNQEEDFWPLTVVRRVAQMAGFIRIYKSRWCLTKQCRSLLDEYGLPAVFLPLLTKYTMQFNWNVRCLITKSIFLQRSFLFSLYLVARYGSEWQPDAFYSKNFLKAFPMAVNDIRPLRMYSPQENYRRYYSNQIFDEFSWFWGLVESESIYEQGSKEKIRVGCRAKASPLLAEVVTFPMLEKKIK